MPRLSLDSVVKTPFFAISQANNIGLQLADFVTTVVGLRFCSYAPFDPYFARLKKAIVSLKDQENRMGSTLKVMRCITKEKALGGPKALGRDKKAQLPALN
jgi:hypothetical protein